MFKYRGSDRVTMDVVQNLIKVSLNLNKFVRFNRVK